MSLLEREILDATDGEAGNLERFYLRLRREVPPVPLADVAEAIRQLVRKGWLEPLSDEKGLPPVDRDDPSLVWRGWFGMTPLGRHNRSSTPGGTSGAATTRYGAWADLNIDIPLEDFQSVRREMSVLAEEKPTK